MMAACGSAGIIRMLYSGRPGNPAAEGMLGRDERPFITTHITVVGLLSILQSGISMSEFMTVLDEPDSKRTTLPSTAFFHPSRRHWRSSSDEAQAGRNRCC